VLSGFLGGGGSMLVILIVFCLVFFWGGGVRVGVYVTHLVNFLWCVFFWGSMLLILLLFCDVLVLGMSILLILLVIDPPKKTPQKINKMSNINTHPHPQKKHNTEN
jgi:hypothetical protein